MKYTKEQFKSVIAYIKEKNRLSKLIGYRNGLIAGIKIAMKSEQEAFMLKAKAEEEKARLIAEMDKLKKEVKPYLEDYSKQMRIARKDVEINGNK